MSYNDIEVYFYDGMTYHDLGLDPDFNDIYDDDYPDFNYDKEASKELKNNIDKNQKEPEQKVKNTEELSLVIKQLSVCQSNIQIRNKIIKILLNTNIDNCISYYAKYEYLPEKYVRLAKENNCLETLIKSFLKAHLHYDITTSICTEINSLLYTIYNVNEDIVYNRVKKIQKFIHEKADTKYGCNAYLKLSPKAMRKLLSTARLHLNIFDAKVLEAETLISIIEKSRNEHLKYDNNTKFTFAGKKTKRDNTKDFVSLAIMDYSLNSIIQKMNTLDINEEIVSYREKILSLFKSYSF
jgi:cupin superfamily acireductone dioxygenase involved in methionine salvage